MSEAGKKQNFLQGAAWLAMATIVVKIIGAIFKFPLQFIIGDEGYSYFTTAYDIYSLLMTVATAGLPLALSRMTSAANALGQGRQVRRIFKTGRAIYLSLGFAGMMLMLLFAKPFSVSQGQPDAWIAVACLAPSAFLISYMSAFRGFFQGQGNMRPTSQSQMLESVIKLVVGLAFAYVLKELTGSLAYAAAGGIIGVTVSCLVSMLFLRSKFTPSWKALGDNPEGVTGYKTILKDLLVIAIPITIGSAGLQLLNLAEVGLYMGNLANIAGNPAIDLDLVAEIKTELLQNPINQALSPALLNSKIASNMKGIYNFMYTFFNMPVAFIGPITISVLPAITEQLTLKKYDMVRETEESAARVTGLLALPCGVGMTLLARPIASLLGYTDARLEFAATVLTILGVCIFFYAAVTFTNSILQSHNYAYIPVINTVVCGVVRLGLVYYLTSNPYIHAIGIPIGGMFSFVSILLLNLFAIYRLAPQKPRLLRNLLRPVLPSAIMGVAVFAARMVLENFLQGGGRLHAVILCGICVLIGVVVYAVAIVLLKTIKKEDCLLLPKGEKIAKLLHL